MKYISQETEKKKPRFLLAVGVQELNVLEGLLDNACRHMPMAGRSGYETGEYMSTARTLRDMNGAVKKALVDARTKVDGQG